MYVLKPVPITDATLHATTPSTETDETEWDGVTTFAADERCMVTTPDVHRIYQSVQDGNLNNDPVTDDGLWWTEISATNIWKALDDKIADQAVSDNADQLEYVIRPDRAIDAVALFNVQADEVQVVVQLESDLSVLYDQTFELVDDSDIIDWYTFFTTDLGDDQQNVLLVPSLPATIDTQITVSVGSGNSGIVRLGEMVLGRAAQLGETLEGSKLALTSFSSKTQDEFGNWNIVQRDYADSVTFDFIADVSSISTVKRTLIGVRDTPAVFFSDPVSYVDSMTYGVFQEFDIPLRNSGDVTITLEIEGLT